MAEKEPSGPVIRTDDRTAQSLKAETPETIPPVRIGRKGILDPLAALVFEVGYRAIQRDRYAYIAPGIPVRTGSRKRGQR
jgi:hypothetical protein